MYSLAGQHLDGTGHDQLLQRLGHRGLLDPPQRHQLGLGQHRLGVPSGPGCQPLPQRGAELVLQLQPIAPTQHELEVGQADRACIVTIACQAQQGGDAVLQRLEQAAQIVTEQPVQRVDHLCLHGRMDQLARIQLQCVIPRLQQLINLGRLKGIEHHRLTEHRTHLVVALHNGANGIGAAHHNQMQAIEQQRTGGEETAWVEVPPAPKPRAETVNPPLRRRMLRTNCWAASTAGPLAWADAARTES